MLSLLLLFFAQDAAPQKEGGGAPGFIQFVPLILIGVVMFWMMSRVKRQEQRQREELHKNLKKNDKVLTTGGIIGIVASLKDNDEEVVLKVDESSNVRLRVVKSAIVRIIGPETSEKVKEGGA